MNTLRSENVQLKGKLAQGEKAIVRKDKAIKHLLNRISTSSSGFYGAAKASIFKKDGDGTSLIELKKKIAELKKKNKSLKENVDSLRRILKVTSAQELRAEVKAYSKECVRLRKIIDELTKKNPQAVLSDTGQKLNEQNKLIIRIKTENKGLTEKIKKLSKKANEWRSKVEPDLYEVQKLKMQIKSMNIIDDIRKEKIESERQEEEYEKVIRNLEVELLNKKQSHFNESKKQLPNGKVDKENIELSLLALKLNLILIEKPIEELKDLLFGNFNDNDMISIHELSRILMRSPLFLKPEDSLTISHYLLEPDTNCNKLQEERFSTIFHKITSLIPPYKVTCSANPELIQKSLLDKMKDKLKILPETLQEASDENGNITPNGLHKACSKLLLELTRDEIDYILLTMYKEKRNIRELHYEDFVDHLGKLLTDIEVNTDPDNLSEERIISIVQKCFTPIAEMILGQGIKIDKLFKGETYKKEMNGEDVELISSEVFFKKMIEIGIQRFSSLEKNCIGKLLAVNENDKGFRINDLMKIIDDYNSMDTEGNITKEMRFEDLDKVSMVILLALTEYMIGSKTSLYDLFESVIHKQPVQIDDAEIELDIINSNDFFSRLNRIGIEINEIENENLHNFLCIDPKYTNKFSLDKLKVAIEEFGTNKELRTHARQCYQDLVDEEQLQEESK